MALTVTSRGTGTHNTGATTLAPGGRSATIAAGSWGVLCVSADNAGSAGAALMAPPYATDSKGNIWIRRTNALYDNGAASAGIEMMFYTAYITTAFLTTDTLTLTWIAGVSPVAKVWTWYEVTASGGNAVQYTTGGNIAGATAANASVTTATVPVGDAVIAGYFSENVAAVTGDSDSTNGSWAAQQTTTIGTTTSGVRIATQAKVQTTTPSTQSYDVTVASQDRIAGYILLHERAAFTGYALAVEALVPLGYWRLNDATNSTSLAAIYGNPLTAATTINSISGAISTDSADNALQRASGNGAQSPDLTFASETSCSIVGWVQYPGSAPGSNTFWFGQRHASGGCDIFMSLLATGDIQARVDGSGAQGDANFTPTLDSNWHFLALTWDGSNARSYEDGSLKNTAACSTTMTANAAVLSLWRDVPAFSTSSTVGLDEIAIFDKTLSGPEITALYAAANLPPPSRGRHPMTQLWSH